MWGLSSLLIFILSLEGSNVINALTAENNVSRNEDIFWGETIECTYRQCHGLTAPGQDHVHKSHLCEDETTGITYTLFSSSDMTTFRSTMEHDFGESGHTKLFISAAAISEDYKVDFDSIDDSTLKVSSDHDGRTLTLTGNQKMLVVLVTDATSSPSQNEAQMYNDVFDDENNLRSRYIECSNNQLIFDPATGTNVNNGVITVTTSNTLNGASWQNCGNWAVAELPSSLDYEFIMIVCPDNVNFGGAAAWGQKPGRKSWYRSTHASKPIAQVHEVGHNLGHHHSGVQATYDDPTCFMGNRGSWSDVGSKFCFNGAKTWYNNWFASKYVEVTPSTDNFDGDLVGQDDVFNNVAGSNTYIVVKVSGSSHTDMFIMYNREKGVTDGVACCGDTVYIVEQSGSGTVSKRLKYLTMSDNKYEVSNWESTGNSMVIEVCDIDTSTPSPDKARILVYVDGVNNLTCEGSTRAPSPPTPNPSPSPVAATLNPTSSPVSPPTKSPTPRPADQFRLQSQLSGDICLQAAKIKKNVKLKTAPCQSINKQYFTVHDYGQLKMASKNLCVKYHKKKKVLQLKKCKGKVTLTFQFGFDKFGSTLVWTRSPNTVLTIRAGGDSDTGKLARLDPRNYTLPDNRQKWIMTG